MSAETLALVTEAHGYLPLDLYRAVATLSPRQRQTTLLVYVVGMTQEETAAALGIPSENVCNALAVSIKKLQKILEIDGGRSGLRVPYTNRR